MRFCLLVLCIALGVFAEQDSLSVDKAVELVLKRHPSITQARAALETMREHSRGLKSINHPTVNGVASYGYIYPDDPISLLGYSAKLLPQNNYDAHLSAEYVLYDFGKRSAFLETGKIAETAADQTLRSVQSDLSYFVMQLFIAAVFLDKSLHVADDGIAELDSHLAVVKKKIDAGSATEFDALKTEVLKSVSLGQRMDMANELAKKQTGLCRLLGIPGNAMLPLKGQFDTTAEQFALETLVQNALANRSERALALNLKESARLKRKNSELENVPVFGIRSSVGIKNGLLPNIDKLQFNVTAGAQISVPLYDGQKSQSHVREAKLNEQSADAAVNSIDERITIEVMQALEDVQAAFQKLDISRSQISFARRSLELAKLKYDAGVITNIDVLDAENDFSGAKLGHLRNQYQYTQNLYALDKAIGKMPFPQ